MKAYQVNPDGTMIEVQLSLEEQQRMQQQYTEKCDSETLELKSTLKWRNKQARTSPPSLPGESHSSMSNGRR